MANLFNELRVSEIKKETSDCISIVLEVPESIKKEYNYTSGQYVTLKVILQGEELRRSYSICSGPYNGKNFRIAVKKVEGGKVSNWLNDHLKVGDFLEVMPPMGNFKLESSGLSFNKNIVLFAGGSGITPMLSIIKTALQQAGKGKVYLIFANRDSASIIFKQELEGIQSDYSDRFQTIHVLEKGEGDYSGRLNGQMMEVIFKSKINPIAIDDYFICGPGAMMEIVKNYLIEKKIEANKINVEYFTAVLKDQNDLEKAENTNTQEVFSGQSRVKVVLDGEEFEFPLNAKGPVLLDAAIEAGIDAPFSCKGAVCCTCKAKVIKGKVRMDNNFSLLDDEVAEGFILTCQSHPDSEELVVDYDQAF